MLSEPMNAIPSPSICPSPWLGDIHKIKELRTDSSLSTEERSIAEFLYSYRGSHATFNAYRREIERLLLWANHYAHKSIGQLTHLDMEQFIEFCQKPPKSWIGLKQSPRFIEHEGTIIPNPEWRLFVVFGAKSTGVSKLTTAHYQLSQKAVQSFFSILGSFFSFLLQENKVQANPMAQIRQKSKFIRQHQHKAPIRRLSELQWSYVIETAEQMAKKDPHHHERTLFIMSALYGMYLRISELAASSRWIPQMSDFAQDHEGNWWFTTVGKIGRASCRERG